MNPLVSIIIPVYNAENYLTECVESALNQTWPNKEVIIIDDGSTDNSLKIAKSFESGEVKIFSQNNKGASAARNYGLSEAKGDYIQFLDADDLLSADKINNQLISLENEPGKLAVCNTVHFNSGDNLSALRPSNYEESFLINADPEFFLTNLHGGYSSNGSMITVHAWLTPRYIIHKAGLWNEELSKDDDGEFFCRVILNSTGVIKTGGISYYRKLTSNNTLSSLKTDKSFKSAVKAIDLIKEKMESFLTPGELYNCFYKSYHEYAIKCYPNHKALSKCCVDNAKTIRQFAKTNSKIQIAIGGSFINFIANNLSWKLARQIQLVIENTKRLLP